MDAKTEHHGPLSSAQAKSFLETLPKNGGAITGRHVPPFLCGGNANEFPRIAAQLAQFGFRHFQQIGAETFP
jgi:hypothetical protein